MFDSNLVIVNFVQNNWIGLLIVIFTLVPILPPEWFNYSSEVYFNVGSSDPNMKSYSQKRQRLSLLHGFVKLVLTTLGTVIYDTVLPFQVIMQYKEAIIIIIFLVVGFDIFYRHQISREAISLVSIGILALYFEQLIEKGKKIDAFFHLFSWEAKDSPLQTLAPVTASLPIIPVAPQPAQKTTAEIEPSSPVRILKKKKS